MPKTTPIMSSFTEGELSPRLDGRTDIQTYFNGASQLQNMTVWQHGGVTKRAGTKFISTAGDPTKAVRLFPFQYSTEVGYVLEFGDEYIRFYTEDGQVQVSGVAYEIVSPYDSTDLADLKFVQSADTMYITHPDYSPRILERFGATNWTITEAGFVNGPFLDQNTDEEWTITPSAVTGTITLTANQSTFDANHVGAYWQFLGTKEVSIDVSGANQYSDPIEADRGDSLIVSVKGDYVATITVQRSFDLGVTWQTFSTFSYNQSFEIVEQRDDFYYRIGVATGDYTSGTPSCSITKLNTSGYAQITGFASDTVVTGTVISELPTSSATFKWAEGAFSTYRGWPQAVAFFEGRLLYAGTLNRPQTIWGSVVDDFENFKYGVTDSSAYMFSLQSSDVNTIQWMTDFNVLAIGSFGGEWKLGNTDEPTTPTNVDAKKQSSHGAADIQGISISHLIVYVQNGGTKLRTMVYDFRNDAYLTPDISVKAEHMFSGGVKELTYVRRPDPTIWMVKNDGNLIGCTYEPLAEIIAYHEHTTDGDFESAAVIKGSDRDELWTIVKRADYETYRDNTDWNLTAGGLGGTWDSTNDRWQSTANVANDNHSIDITASGTWTSSYRPTDITVTVVGASTDLYLYDTISGAIVNSTSYTSDTETDITFASNDINQLTLSTASGTNTTFYITNIRFRIADTRHIEQFQTTEWTDQEDAIYLDSALTYSGTAATTVSGLDHLEGHEVAIVTNGAIHPNLVVKDGQIGPLQWSTTKLHAGLPFTSTVQTMDIDAGGVGGTAQTKRRAIHYCNLRLKDTIGVKIGPEDGELDAIPFRDSSMLMGQAVELFTGDKLWAYPGGFATTQKVRIVSDQPLPFTLIAFIPTITTADV